MQHAGPACPCKCDQHYPSAFGCYGRGLCIAGHSRLGSARLCCTCAHGREYCWRFFNGEAKSCVAGSYLYRPHVLGGRMDGICMNWIWYIITGLCAGIVAGMGMGGGTLLIPVLTLALGLEQHAAQGVNVIAFLPAAVAALVVHAKAGRLQQRACVPIILAGALGALGASLLAGVLEAPWLRRMFGVFLVLLACLRVFGKKLKK